MNIYFADPSLAKLSASHMYAWEQGLKTGQYYLRSRPAKDAIQFTLDNDNLDDKAVTKNLSKADMDKKRREDREDRHAKKRAATVNVEDVDKEVAKVTATNLNKKQRTSAVASPIKEEKAATTGTVEKPWEGKEEKEDDQDYRWNICENC